MGAPREDGEAEIHACSVMLSSSEHGLIARMDLVEGCGKKTTPVDYKKGSVPDNEERSWPADRAQLCAQALILRDNGYVCNQGIIYYAKSKRRVEIPIDDSLVEWTLNCLTDCRKTAAGDEIPPPLDDSPKCPGCSLSGVCLPDETRLLTSDDDIEIRRLYPARDDAIPLYVRDYRAILAKKGEEIVIKSRGEIVERVRLMEVSRSQSSARPG